MGVQASHIFVNLPVKNLDQSKAFFQEIGFEFDEQMTDEKGACMIVGPTIYVMLLTEDFFKSFSKREIADTASSAEVITAISADSKAEVDELVSNAFKAGGQQANEKMDDEFMYLKSFKDLDGHMWEVIYMPQDETE
ncbi:glyoxalase/bleomycin resistance/extradiol dioxygenase family protein [Planococcus sp. CPCC 101016]|uniref:VOC family protein n=1 Tax=Planococcus sp. CPCC 101016 TaxID=2599617 RepID=UPI0011B78941|nr:VOC family protein [Planococcus sp. CPCC 101016]TWT07466.1 glyoxalase/bleomycin resistance/extradiol dioxygenase family protein [Planococcus sp. CPCC 101016]